MLKSTANKALLVAALVSVFAPATAAGEATKGVTVNVTTAAATPAVVAPVAPAAPAAPGRLTTAYNTAKDFYTGNSRSVNIFNVLGSLAIAKVAWDVVSSVTASNSAE